jgi:hypothetical protein
VRHAAWTSPWVVAAAAALSPSSTTQAAEPAQSAPHKAEEVLLDALQGRWNMTGTVMGMPVRYHAEGARVLQGGFLRLHMIDASSPPQYEASVYLGYDPKAGDYIAHWLDNFGAAGARVVGTGSRQGSDRIVILYPYADGTFRNTFTWTAATRSWTLLIESQQANGRWTTFASYTLTPA